MATFSGNKKRIIETNQKPGRSNATVDFVCVKRIFDSLAAADPTDLRFSSSDFDISISPSSIFFSVFFFSFYVGTFKKCFGAVYCSLSRCIYVANKSSLCKESIITTSLLLKRVFTLVYRISDAGGGLYLAYSFSTFRFTIQSRPRNSSCAGE